VHARERLIVALDVSSLDEALDVVSELGDCVGMFKLGLELIYSVGLGAVADIQRAGGRVFLDTKLLDIPNTVAGASRGISRLGTAMFNVHATGGVEMMKAARFARDEAVPETGGRKPIILAVTLLTSISNVIAQKELLIPQSTSEYVKHLAQLTCEAGLDGIVCSPVETEYLRSCLPSTFKIVTPGVRPTWASPGDQKRVATPRQAIDSGADYVVLGRPILKPPSKVGSRRAAALRVLEEMS
jgi:orotidine-5'-phosphate decarboxylase